LPHPIDSVEFMNPFSYKEFEQDKLVCVDVKATDRSGRVFIVEVQIVSTRRKSCKLCYQDWHFYERPKS
jgi:hypothetical protein